MALIVQPTRVPYVSRDMIRAIEPMEMQAFLLPTARAAASALMQVSHVKNLDGYQFRTSTEKDGQRRIVKILRIR